MTRRSRHPRRAFTLLELLVVVGILAILISVLVPTVSAVRRSGKRTECLANLRQIGVAFTLFADSHNGRLPDPGSVQASWESQLINSLDPRVFRCNADEELFPAVGSSYDWHDTGNPLTTLAGKLLREAPADTVLAFDCLPGWHGKRKMNAVNVGGGAETMDDQKCLENLARPLRGAAAP